MIPTARLHLRPVEPRDAEALHRHWMQPEVRRYLWDGEIIPLLHVENLVEQSTGQFVREGHGLWAMRLREDEVTGLIGCGGFWRFHEPPTLELVLSLDPAWWRQGLAQEAGCALIAYGFDHLSFDAVWGSTDAPNAASIRLMERLGMRFFHRAEADGLDTVSYRVTASEWVH
ncbi:MAG: GNAT family N-acetyltransferase [Rhodothermaceae bacterium]|nr:GNAT family N-acetyltransferase [Rhodothermaceae bacterium]